MFYQSIDEQFQIKKRFNSIGSKKGLSFKCMKQINVHVLKNNQNILVMYVSKQ